MHVSLKSETNMPSEYGRAMVEPAMQRLESQCRHVFFNQYVGNVKKTLSNVYFIANVGSYRPFKIFVVRIVMNSDN